MRDYFTHFPYLRAAPRKQGSKPLATLSRKHGRRLVSAVTRRLSAALRTRMTKP